MTPSAAAGDGVETIEIQTEMEQSFLDYAMSVIVARALPDVRDGLKPVHRRILWSMASNGLRHDRGHVKCATVVGDVIARYHPHGDTAVYDALVRMGQDFSLRHLLIDPHGNFGSPADPPAAYRYTECRLSELSGAMLAGLDEETVDFVANFDGRHREPEVLPSRFPNLLVNGSQGIAVGMATNIPPHNFGEIADAVLHLLAHPDATVEELMQFVRGPDFPTGGQILGRSGIEEAYRTGRGTLRLRGQAEIATEGRATRIVVSQIPYQVSVEAIERRAAHLVETKVLTGIRDIRNESAKGRTRLVFELTRDAPALVILNNLYKHTPLQVSFSVNIVALVDGVPRTLSLAELLRAYVAHQVEVVRRRSEFRLARATERAHIVEGLLRALDMLDEVIALIRSSDDRPEARSGLMAEPFDFSEVQANHILDTPLGRLTRLGRSELAAELDELRATIAELEAILADESRLRGVIRGELSALREQFVDARRTELAIDPGEFDIEDLIDDEDLVFIMTGGGYVKTTSADAFRTQGRGGRGVAGAKLKEGDYISAVIHTSAHAYLLFFTNRGRVHRLRAHQIPMAGRSARGTAVVNLLQLAEGERVAAVIDTRDYETNPYLVFATRRGRVKKTKFSAYQSRYRGLRAINLRDDDELVQVLPFGEGDHVCLVTRRGNLLRFTSSAEEVRATGRETQGVQGMRMRQRDEVVAMVRERPDQQLLIVTDEGFGKRTGFDAFTSRHRGGLGMRAVRLVERKGEVVAALGVSESDEVMVVASDGVVIRLPVADVSAQGRDATGVKVMKIDGDRKVSAVTLVPREEP
ncbi:MAG: DNA gyrase subunit A [bacterium]|nr:DNA gyrase subunit A [bacterium]MCY4103829.1 DNA gyrase subunit A [bacterium]